MRATESIDKTGAASLRFLYNTAVGRILLRPLICRPVSYIAGRFLDCRLSAVLVQRFIRSNNIDMSDYEQRKYKSFNDFFTRKVLPNARPICEAHNSFISPADARLTAFEITPESRFNIKGVDYSIAELLKNKPLADEFDGGICLIFRLAVDNYHRYGWCADGEAEKTVHIKGRYHTVQPIAMRRFPIFRENTREYTAINTDLFGKIVQVEVGALMVGRICNNRVDGCRAEKGKEKGRFEFGGSTVIVLLQKDKVKIDREFFENTENNSETAVKYGEKLGTGI